MVAAAHQASGHATNADSSQLELAANDDDEQLAIESINLSAEFEGHVPGAIKDAVDNHLPDAVPSSEATLLRLQAEELRHTDSLISEAPKHSFKQRYTEEPGLPLNAEAAYEMFHNLFYLSGAPRLSPSEVGILQKLQCPEEANDYGTKQCALEIKILSEATSTLAGRTILVLVLNQFRSKKVSVCCLSLSLSLPY